MTIVVDASVAAHWYFPSAATERALTILAADERRIAPELLLNEMGNIAWKLARAGQIDQAAATGAFAALRHAIAEFISAQVYMERAFVIARDLDHSIYDCFYLALAEGNDATLATFDKRLIRRVEATRWRHVLHPIAREATG